jgi:GH15 family glucan-1,4-alpha-glucosidase
MRTAALVARDGTIDFLCVPEFDSPTVFAALLDAERGGSFTIAPRLTGARIDQRYLRDTNVLVTRFVGAEAEVELVDFMVLGHKRPGSAIVRIVRAIRGQPSIQLHCAPRFEYAQLSHAVEPIAGGVMFRATDGRMLRLASKVKLAIDGRDVRGHVTLTPGQPAAFVLEPLDAARPTPMIDDRAARRALRQTIVFWRRWIARCTYRGEWRRAVRRSALTLKLLQSRRTGAIIAAPTFGLPEQVGGARNWDFRYAWVRDASYTVYALVRVGLLEEARAFTKWVVRRCEEASTPGELQSVYAIDGRRLLIETTLDYLQGYRGSRPVRVGNAAYEQLQLDIYGELVDALYIADAHGVVVTHAAWPRIVELTNWVCTNWTRPDQGIWEVRSGRQEFLFSRVMCWVGVDRALRIARRHRFLAPHNEWRATRQRIRDDVETHFWNDRIGAFVGAKGSAAVDAGCLVMPLVGFIDPRDPRWLSTLRVVEQRLVRDWLVRRYDMQGMDTDAASPTAPAFTILSFWYIECLSRAGFTDAARSGMERLLAYANHLGLFAEDIAADRTQLGNFPQGLVHAALIGAAVEARKS